MHRAVVSARSMWASAGPIFINSNKAALQIALCTLAH